MRAAGVSVCTVRRNCSSACRRLGFSCRATEQSAGAEFGPLEPGARGGATIPHDLAATGVLGCWRSTDAPHTRYSLADVTGPASSAFNLPVRPDLLGSWIRFQGLAVDPAYDGVGLLTSQPGQGQARGLGRVVRVWASGSAATTGAREFGITPRLQISLR